MHSTDNAVINTRSAFCRRRNSCEFFDMVESQPLQEVEVYRGLDDVDLLEGRGLPGDEEDEEDEEA